MSTTSNPVIRVTRSFSFPAERVFDAWLDPAFAAKWLYTTPESEIVRAEVDPKIGGRFTFTDRRAGEDTEHTGEYLEIDRPRRLVFTFGVLKYEPNYDLVTIEIVPDASGTGCELTLTQEMTAGDKWAADTQKGWTTLLGSLSTTLGDKSAAINLESGQFIAPGEVRFVRLLPGPIERVWEYLTDSEKRGTWLGTGPMELRAGGKADLFFRHANLAPDETPPEKYKEYHETGDGFVSLVTQCEPPRLLSYTWEGDSPEQDSEVTFELTPKGDQVELVLTHRRLRADQQSGVGAGWHTHLAMLIAHLSGKKPPLFWATHAYLVGGYAKRL